MPRHWVVTHFEIYSLIITGTQYLSRCGSNVIQLISPIEYYVPAIRCGFSAHCSATAAEAARCEASTCRRHCEPTAKQSTFTRVAFHRFTTLAMALEQAAKSSRGAGRCCPSNAVADHPTRRL